MTLDDVYGPEMDDFPLEQDDWDDFQVLEWYEVRPGKLIEIEYPAAPDGD